MSAVEVVTVPGVVIYRITGAKALDPITVYIEDVAPGRAQLVVHCYGMAWAGFWGGCGDKGLINFLTSCGADYIAGKLICTSRKLSEKARAEESKYLTRIVAAVQIALAGLKS